MSVVISIEGLILDVIGASLLATLDTEWLYGRYANEDASDRVNAFYDGYEELSRKLELDNTNSKFRPLAMAVKQALDDKVEITALKIDVSEVNSWERLFANRENPIQAFEQHHMIFKNLPQVRAITDSDEEIPLGSHRHVKRMVPVQNYVRDQNQKYFRSAMIIFILGFSFQIFSYAF
ncbi:hypothetical protein [Halopelagius fulvigenes]